MVGCPFPIGPPLLLLPLTSLQLIVPAGPHMCHTCSHHGAHALALGLEHSSQDTRWDNAFTWFQSLTKSHFLYQAYLDCHEESSRLSLLPTAPGHILSLSAHFIYAFFFFFLPCARHFLAFSIIYFFTGVIIYCLIPSVMIIFSKCNDFHVIMIMLVITIITIIITQDNT